MCRQNDEGSSKDFDTNRLQTDWWLGWFTEEDEVESIWFSEVSSAMDDELSQENSLRRNQDIWYHDKTQKVNNSDLISLISKTSTNKPTDTSWVLTR